MKILTVAGAKGGVGKSTSAISLAVEIAARGYQVALQDLDPQSSATLALGQDPVADPWAAEPIPLALEGLMSGALRLHPGGRSLARAGAGDVERLLSHQENVQVLVVDTPPFLGALTIGALKAASMILVPIEPAPMALPGLGDVVEIVREFGPSERVLRTVLVRVQGRRAVTSDIRQSIEEEYPGVLYDAEVPEDVRCTEAPAYGLPVTVYAAQCRAAEAYRRLTDEVLADLRVAGLDA